LTGGSATSSAQLGYSVAISVDGSTAIVGANQDSGGVGSAIVFTRGSGTWPQQARLTASDPIGNPQQGTSVSISNDGNTAIVGGQYDNGQFGAAWVFVRSGTSWNQFGQKLQPNSLNSFSPHQGISVGMSGDGSTALVGGYGDNGSTGAAWVFTRSSNTNTNPATHFSISAPGSATSGTAISFTLTALDANNNATTGYTGIVHFTSTDPAATLPANTTLALGTGTFPATLNTPGNQSIVATDTVTATINGTSNGILVAGNTYPSTLSPRSGSGTSVTMTLVFTDNRGATDLNIVNALINNFLDGHNSCYIAFSQPANTLYLVANDSGTLLPLVLGTANSVANGQCTILGTGSSAVLSGNNLTLTLNMTFTAAFAGNKVVYLAARDLQSGNSGWQALGVWQVPGFTTFPAVGTPIPAQQSGLGPANMTFSFTDTKGFADLGILNILGNNFLDGKNACYLAYSRSANTLYLVNDLGAALVGGVTPGAAGAVSNSQCSINGALSAVQQSGNTIQLSVSFTFTNGFKGNRIVYAAARDATDANTSGWQAVGSWTVQ
jgi:hypothetical protein